MTEKLLKSDQISAQTSFCSVIVFTDYFDLKKSDLQVVGKSK